MANVQIKDYDVIKSDFIDFLKVRVEQNGGPTINDYNVGSVLDILVSAFADVLEENYFNIFQITKASLENIYNGFNFYKIPGKKAITTVSIYFNTDDLSTAQNSMFLSIPRGTKISTEDGTIEFELIDDYDSSKLVKEVTGEFVGKIVYKTTATSITVGNFNNVLENKLTKLASEITNSNGWSVYIKNTSASGGANEETEEDMKNRFQKYLVSLRRGSKEAIEYALLSNAAFTGLIYSINKFSPLYVLKQIASDYSAGTGKNISLNLSLDNKFSPLYSLCRDEDAPSSTSDKFAVYFGYEEKFFNLLFSTSTIPISGNYRIESIKFWDNITSDWLDVSSQNISFPHNIISDQYINWTLSSPRWTKTQVSDYNAYFIKIEMTKSIATGLEDFEVYKSMTYPFPGYIDIYCLKNYRQPINDTDKTLISESIEDYKAAGVITSISSGSVVQLYPTVIIYVSSETLPLIPPDLIDNIRSDIVNYANSIEISQTFDRNSLYATLYSKYSQYGIIYIYYKYDVSINESLTNGIYKEAFRDVLFDAAINEKPDLNFSDVYVLSNLTKLSMTTTGSMLGNSSGDYDPTYHVAY